ncbi:hypothetical protein ACVH9Z_28510 [Rhodococcus opacus]|uniref:hypothetical protein n=1 Tax=Rhodococcus opacus TaxID=37919 RepID=UPI0023E3D2BA|nr:hypothetical protein [Rhodococcus opacus]MDJ0420242.1 hypothetical protein [Rhodococcus opacus]WKN52697.1 hypothetical protein HJ581_0001600 [Rhodococcus opacus]
MRTDPEVHRVLPAVSEHGRAIKALAGQHQEAIWALHQTISRLRSVLLEFYPQALQTFPHLKHRAALTVLTAVPTPSADQKLTRRRLKILLRRSGRRNDPNLVEQILNDLKSPALRQPPQVEAALGAVTTGLLGIIAPMHQAVDALEEELGRTFDTHPLAPILRSGSGPRTDPCSPHPR